MTSVRVVLLALLLGILPGCRRAVLYAVPEPLPEALPWSGGGPATGAFLGVATRENDSGSLEDLFFAPGVKVVDVADNSPAAAAGIAPGDVLLSIDGREFDDPGALDGWLAAREPGDATLVVQRDDSAFEVDVTLEGREGAIPEPELLYRDDPARTGAGWATDVGGVRLVVAHATSPVVDAGVPLGSLVTALDGDDVRSDRELVRRLVALDPGTRVELTYEEPGGAVRTKEVELLEAPTYVAGFSVPVLFHYAHDPAKEETTFVLLDLWLISLLRFEREGRERTWRILRFFSFSSGVGELTE